MNTHTFKTQQNPKRAAAHRFEDTRASKSAANLSTGMKSQAVVQGKLEEEELLQGKFQTIQRKGGGLEEEEELLQGKFEPIQPKKNTTGLPDSLKSGVENLSGISMDDVQVHYNSDKPSQLQAHAYAQGTDIHIAPGQEKHLPHEAWHVVQQKQGRVQPTMQMMGKANVNDDAGLENEADMMGAKALLLSQPSKQYTVHPNFLSDGAVQRMQVLQFVRMEPKGINGLTHLVEMTSEGHLFNAQDWLKNEREEVNSKDRLMVDMDDAIYSHRGMNQEINWQRDGEGSQDHLWVLAVDLNNKPLGRDRYVREEMLIDGWEGWEDLPKTMHSIWVQGNYNSNSEATEGLKTRTGSEMNGWVNMMWLYNTGMEPKGFSPQLQSEPMDVRTSQIGKVLERSFVDEMRAWKETGGMPEWVQKWLPILDVLFAKKSFITMSDIMRMIILYYEGGVYMDVKIKIQPEKTTFKDRPMLLIDIANFHNAENWAIMANAGCKMIEEIMIRALDQFPSIEKLHTYPENYQQGGKEGKSHVELHEQKGVWNVIEKYRGNHSYSLGLGLTNPRPINSWSDAYDDRDQNEIKKEEIASKKGIMTSLQSKMDSCIKNSERLKEQQLTIGQNAILAKLLGLSDAQVNKLPEDIEKIGREIRTLKDSIDFLDLEIAALEADDNDVANEGDDDSDEFFRRLEALK